MDNVPLIFKETRSEYAIHTNTCHDCKTNRPDDQVSCKPKSSKWCQPTVYPFKQRGLGTKCQYPENNSRTSRLSTYPIVDGHPIRSCKHPSTVKHNVGTDWTTPAVRPNGTNHDPESVIASANASGAGKAPSSTPGTRFQFCQ